MPAFAGCTTPSSLPVRIVAGTWRGRALVAPPGAATRPTADRVRQALFDMLLHAPWGGREAVEGVRALDVFAGTGAFGLEALSRGAAHVTCVENDRRAAAAIDAVVREWHEDALTVEAADALVWLQRVPRALPFDIVFLDPPYDAGLLSSAAAALVAGKLLATDARIYVEQRAREPLAELPDGWQSIRDGRAGEVGYHLFAT